MYLKKGEGVRTGDPNKEKKIYKKKLLFLFHYYVYFLSSFIKLKYQPPLYRMLYVDFQQFILLLSLKFSIP